MKLRFLISSILFFFTFSLQAQLYINEVSQGTGNKEYVELIVAGTPVCGDSTVNLQGWILDDNCGFFGTNGIAGGHIKFTNNPQWSAIKYGTIIIIYREDDIFPGITEDETDANNDDIFVLPSSSNLFDKQTTIPLGGSSSAVTSYTTSGYTNGGGSWVMLGMANGGDAFQTVSPTNLTTSFHSVGWGGSISGTDIHFSGSASGLSFVNENIIDNDPRNQANWVSIDALTLGSPATTNSTANNTWRNNLLSQASAGGNVNVTEYFSICFGDSSYLENAWQTTNGSYFDTILALTGTGCDTIITSILSVSIAPVSNNLPNICTNNPSLAIIDTVVTQQSIGGCDSLYTITETVYNTIITESLGDTIFCSDKNIEIQLFGLILTEAGIYTNTLPNILGCDSVLQSFEIIVNPTPIINASNDESILNGNTISISAEGGDTYVWSTNETDQTINVSPSETTTYFVTGTDLNNCNNSDSVTITVITEEVEILIPTAFTPNQDGLNDTFRIVNEYAFEEIDLRVYNRWGAIVFQSDNINLGWDGLYNSIPQEQDLFIYYIDAQSKATKEKISISGSVTLLR